MPSRCSSRSRRRSSRAPGRPASPQSSPSRYQGRKVGTVLCGGNIDTHLLANVLVRELVRSGRIARLRIALQDRPGALAAATAIFHECSVNILEVHHHRIFTHLPAKDTMIEVQCEARDESGIARLITTLEAAQFTVDRISFDWRRDALAAAPFRDRHRINPLSARPTLSKRLGE
jgi:predicted amino acid-binding ACT domain protein